MKVTLRISLLTAIGFVPTIAILSLPGLEVTFFQLGTVTGNALFNSAVLPLVCYLGMRTRGSLAGIGPFLDGMALGYINGILIRLVASTIVGRPVAVAFLVWGLHLSSQAGMIWLLVNAVATAAISLAAALAHRARLLTQTGK
jgi:hypothetical protein